MKEQSNRKRTLLILATIFILGPLIFVGSCLPMAIGINAYDGNDLANPLFIIGFPLLISIFAVLLIIKEINKSD